MGARNAARPVMRSGTVSLSSGAGVPASFDEAFPEFCSLVMLHSLGKHTARAAIDGSSVSRAGFRLALISDSDDAQEFAYLAIGG